MCRKYEFISLISILLKPFWSKHCFSLRNVNEKRKQTNSINGIPGGNYKRGHTILL